MPYKDDLEVNVIFRLLIANDSNSVLAFMFRIDISLLDDNRKGIITIENDFC